MPHLPRPRTLALPLAAGLGLLLAGCSTVSSVSESVSKKVTDGMSRVVKPYRVEIVQGNVVTREQLALVKPGVSRNDVREILGSPLLSDPFHAERWDYVFSLRRDGRTALRRNLIVWFDGETVRQVESPELPTEQEFVASIASDVKGRSRRLALTDEERAALPAPKPTPATATPLAAPQGAERTYPPLEPR